MRYCLKGVLLTACPEMESRCAHSFRCPGETAGERILQRSALEEEIRARSDSGRGMHRTGAHSSLASAGPVSVLSYVRLWKGEATGTLQRCSCLVMRPYSRTSVSIERRVPPLPSGRGIWTLATVANRPHVGPVRRRSCLLSGVVLGLLGGGAHRSRRLHPTSHPGGRQTATGPSTALERTLESISSPRTECGLAGSWGACPEVSTPLHTTLPEAPPGSARRAC